LLSIHQQQQLGRKRTSRGSNPRRLKLFVSN
jgi:hypothetical protein